MITDWINMFKRNREAGMALGKAAPKFAMALQGLNMNQNSNGALEPKMREMIALAVAVTTRCDGCIAAHANAAVQAGATEAELADALGTAIALNTGAAYVYSVRALDAFKQFSEAASQ